MWDSNGQQRENEYYLKRGLPAPEGLLPPDRLPGLEGHPGHVGRLRQFLHGFALPLHLARLHLADPEARRFYFKVCLAQAVVAIALGLVFMESGTKVAVDLSERRAARLAERARAKAELEASALELKATLAEATRTGDLAATERATERMRRNLERVQARPPLPPPEAPGWRRFTPLDLEFWAALYAALYFTQWAVIALSRDYHDVISRDLSLRTSLEPEDGPLTPRVHLNVPWLRSRLMRRIRALRLFVMGMPALFLLSLPLRLLGVKSAFAVLSAVWGAWWLVVFTAAKSSRAWKDEDVPAPWFIRGWRWLTTQVPGLRWVALQAYGGAWASASDSVRAPMGTVERQPWAFAGLAVMRALALLPVVRLFLRPFIPVAAAHLIEARRASAPVHLPLPAAAPAEAPTRAANG